MRQADGETEALYEISEMAGLFGISRQTLIYYDRIGLFKPALVNEHGYRFYAPTQIPLLRLICMLREVGVELKVIERLVAARDVSAIVDNLRERLKQIDARAAELDRQRASVAERLAFYRDVETWREQLDRPLLRRYPERYVVFEPFPAGEVGRAELHATLMRAVIRLRDASGVGPMCGWGAMLPRSSMRGDDPLAGAGSFVTVPEGVDPGRLSGVRTLPEGIYLCLSHWGMPYDLVGVRRLAAALDEHRLTPVGDAFDFCLLDTTAYDELHSEDLCCLKIRVEL